MEGLAAGHTRFSKLQKQYGWCTVLDVVIPIVQPKHMGIPQQHSSLNCQNTALIINVHACIC